MIVFDWSEFREWSELVLACAGGAIALITYRQSVKQQRIDNAMKMTQWFHSLNDQEALNCWFDLLNSSCDSAGAKQGYYVTNDGKLSPLDDYLDITSPDGGKINKMMDSFEVICYEINKKTIDARFVWFELGQLLERIYYWLQQMKTPENGTYLGFYPSIAKTFSIYKKKFNTWPSRTYFRFDP